MTYDANGNFYTYFLPEVAKVGKKENVSNSGTTAPSQSDRGWYNKASKANYDVGVIAEGMSDLGAISKIIRIGEFVSKSTVFTGIVIDGFGVYNYYRNGANSPTAVSPDKAATNTIFGVYGVMNPAVSVTYFGVDLFYPGGWPGYLTNWHNSLNPDNIPVQEQVIMQNSMSPF